MNHPYLSKMKARGQITSIPELASIVSKSLLIDAPVRQAVILAAGKGTRLDPVTKTIPKPMIEVHGRPILEHLIEYFREHGVFDIIMSVGHLQHVIRDHFGDGHAHGVHITFIDNADLPGSAGVLVSAEPYLDDHFIVTNSDEFKDLNLHMLMRTHLDSKSIGTLGITIVEDPTQYGVVDLDGHHIKRFVEKPSIDEAPSNWINAGIYAFSRDVLGFIPPHRPTMTERDVFPQLAAEGKLIGHRFNGQWFDTGTPERLEKTRAEWKGYSFTRV